jgi:hypothetical protein
MDEPFHPSSLSEILDRTAQLYRSRFLVFLGIAVIPTAALLVPFGGLFLFVEWYGPNGGAHSPVAGMVAGLLLGALFLVALPIFLVASALATAAMGHTASRAILSQTTTIREAYKAVWPRGWRYIGLDLMEFVTVWVAPFTAWFVLALLYAGLSALEGGNNGGGFLTLLIFLIIAGLVTYSVWMSLRLSLAFPATLVEQSGPWAALTRSAKLTKGTKGRIFVLYLLAMALEWILAFAVMVPLLIVAAMIPGIDSPQHAQALGTVTIFVIYGARFAIQAFTRPVYGIALMLFYYDQRIRQEAFDIEWMMLRAGLVVPVQAQPLPEAQPQLQTEPQLSMPQVFAVENQPPAEAAPVIFTEPSAEHFAELFTEPAAGPVSELVAEPVADLSSGTEVSSHTEPTVDPINPPLGENI